LFSILELVTEPVCDPPSPRRLALFLSTTKKGQGRVFISYELHPIVIFVQRITILQMKRINAVETISLKFKFAIIALAALCGVLAYLLFSNNY
jgi:hypothetical protein